MKPGIQDYRDNPALLGQSLKAAAAGDPAIWIHRLSDSERAGYGAEGVLAGVPFAIKDNIDLAGVPTTAACPAYAYRPGASATVVDRLLRAGAVPVGKTNLDQFATGLVGTRSPYGVPQNCFDPERIPGGSSSGSAAAVAAGHVAFALGTDTAGSGRVPAAFQNLVGLKPTRGLLSTSGVVPACRTLDCVSIFTHTVDDARTVLSVTGGFDPTDPWSRVAPEPTAPSGPIRFAVPQESQLSFFGNEAYRLAFAQAVARCEERGWMKHTIDFSPFLETARLLYEGPWVAERYTVIESLLTEHPEALLPVTRGIIEKGGASSAADAFRSTYRLQELRRACESLWVDVDVLLTPTAGTHYRLEDVAADPVGTNSNLGYYTNFMNLLDLCAIAVPAGWVEGNLPFGVTFCAPAFQDGFLLEVGGQFASHAAESGLPQGWTRFAVCGAHLRGLPLNHQITERGGRFIAEVRSSPKYRLVAMDTVPPKPGMIYRPGGGAAVDMELWEMPTTAFGSFVEKIPFPLAMGKVELMDGSWVSGFTCDASAAGTATDITALGSWRRFLSDTP